MSAQVCKKIGKRKQKIKRLKASHISVTASVTVNLWCSPRNERFSWKAVRGAHMIDARGWPVCVLSYWCINYIEESCPNMSCTICRLSSQREQAGLRLIIGLSYSSQVFQCRRIRYTTIEDVTVAATVPRMEGNTRQGIELLNVSHQQQNACLEV